MALPLSVFVIWGKSPRPMAGNPLGISIWEAVTPQASQVCHPQGWHHTTSGNTFPSSGELLGWLTHLVESHLSTQEVLPPQVWHRHLADLIQLSKPTKKKYSLPFAETVFCWFSKLYRANEGRGEHQKQHTRACSCRAEKGANQGSRFKSATEPHH